MDRDETIIEIVSRLERAVTRLERVLDGDQQLSSPGMLAQHRQLMVDVAAIKEELAGRRTNAAQWFVGYLLFVSAFAASSDRMQDYFGIPPLAAMTLVMSLVALAFVFFANGLGFIRWSR